MDTADLPSAVHIIDVVPSPASGGWPPGVGEGVQMGNVISQRVPYKMIWSLLFVIVVGLSVGLLTTAYYQFAIVPSLATLSVILLSRYPQVGYYLILFLVPFGSFRGDLPWFLALAVIAVIFFQLAIQKRMPPPPASTLWIWLVLFFALCLISALLSAYQATAFSNIWLLLASYLFIALNMIFLSSREDLTQYLPAVIVGSIALSVVMGIIGVAFGVPFGTIQGRGSGGAVNPNNMALMINFSLPIVAYFVFEAKHGYVKAGAAILFVMNIAGLILTYSRAGALVCVATLAFIMWTYRRLITPRRVGLVLALALLALVTFGLSIPSSYWERQKSLTNPQSETSLSRRLSYIQVGWDAFKQDPLLGAGFGTFPDLYERSEQAREFIKKGRYNERRFAHNTYLQVLVDTGTLGFLLFLGILGRAWTNFMKAKRKFLEYGDLSMASLVGAYQLSFLSLMLYLAFHSNIYHKYLLLSLALSEVTLMLAAKHEAS